MSNVSRADAVLIDTGFDGQQRFILEERSQPHLGLAYIAAYLERHHYRVKIIDRIVNPMEPAEVAAAAIVGGFVQVYPGTQLEALSIAQGDINRNFSWNTPYIAPTALKYSNTPNQHNKLPTLPIYVPTQISLDNILIINTIMTYLAKFINLNLAVFDRVLGKRDL